MESQITYNEEIDLSAPTGGVLTAIFVAIDIEPRDAGCLIYGTRPNGDIQPVEVRGPHPELELPFAHPKIHVKYLRGLTKLSISTLGWRDSARS